MAEEDASFDGPDRVRSETGLTYVSVRLPCADILAPWPTEYASIIRSKKRGPPPVQFNRVVSRMRDMPLDRLKKMKEEEMMAEFGAFATPAAKHAPVLSEN
jgi:hypothetical protein